MKKVSIHKNNSVNNNQKGLNKPQNRNNVTFLKITFNMTKLIFWPFIKFNKSLDVEKKKTKCALIIFFSIITGVVVSAAVALTLGLRLGAPNGLHFGFLKILI